jgi:glucan phosphoethanolaminetransferase (alkaline phosphatase superfamily)
MEANHLSNDWFTNEQRAFATNKSLCISFVFFFLTSIRRISLTMNTRVLNIVLPIIAAILYICIDFLYIFLAKGRYQAVVENIQKDKMEVDAAAAIVCYTR